MLETKTRNKSLRWLFGIDAEQPPLPPRPQQITSHVIRVTKEGFVPAILSIRAGDAVTIMNECAELHSASCERGAFDTGILGTGDSASMTFGGPGRYRYSSLVNRQMIGEIVVT